MHPIQLNAEAKMNDDNVLSQIPGEILDEAGYALPPAESCAIDTLRRVVQLADGRRAEVTFVKQCGRRGRTTRWFWTPVDAQMVSDD